MRAPALLRALTSALLLTAGAGAAAPAAPDLAALLAANRAAAGGVAWAGKAALRLDFAYAGQGLTGRTGSLEDLRQPGFVDTAVVGPDRTASGFDGVRAWLREPSGTVTFQGAGDVVPLAINEAFRDANLWWRPDMGGASISLVGRRQANGRSFDVVRVQPRGGEPFEAWFDARTHLLARTVEAQATLTITTLFSDYAPVQGAMIARRQVIDDGSGAQNRQVLTLTEARFLPAQPRSAFAAPTAHLHDFFLAGGVQETTVPFQLINNHIYASARVNGGPPMRFLFDTGGHDILTPASAKALGVMVSGAQTSTGAGASVAQSGVATVRRIEVGAATLTDQPVSVLDFDNAAEGVDEQGMIGYEFFARFVTRIDYAHHTLTFIDPKAFDPRGAGAAVPFAFYGQFPVVRGAYDGVPGAFGIDTGARTALSLTGPFVAAHQFRAHAGKGIEALTGWGVGGPSRSFVTRGGALKLGHVVIAHPLTEFSLDTGGAMAAPAFPNNVGAGVLKRFVVTLDYPHYRLFLKPVTGPVADLDTFDRSGLWLNQAPGGFAIVDVTPSGPAQGAGLAKGEVITAVDGRPAGAIRLYDLRRDLRDDPPGTVVTFTVKTAAGERRIAVTLRDQI